MTRRGLIKIILTLIVLIGIYKYAENHYKDFFPNLKTDNLFESIKNNIFSVSHFTGPGVVKTSPIFKDIKLFGFGNISGSKEIAKVSFGSEVSGRSYGKGSTKIYSVTVKGNQSIIVIYNSLQQKDALNLSGWKIKTGLGEFSLPEEIYFDDSKNKVVSQDLIMRGGDYIYVYSSRTQEDRTFQLNKCSIYINSQTCRNQISGVSYPSCILSNTGKSDFLGRNWRVVSCDFNISQMSKDHDTIQIINKSGEIVEEYIY